MARIVHPKIEPLLQITIGADETGKPTLAWHQDSEAIAAASRLDGLSRPSPPTCPTR